MGLKFSYLACILGEGMIIVDNLFKILIYRLYASDMVN